MTTPAQRPTLWGAGTSRTLRAHWALAEVGIDYHARPIGPRTGETQQPEFLKMNPKGKVPVLIDGDLVLTESAAIVRYLFERYGDANTPSVIERARYDEWQSFILMELDAHTLYVMRKHGDLKDLYGEAPAAMKAAREGFVRQVAVADERLSQSPYLLGDEFSGVDILLASCLDWAVVYQVPITPALDQWRQSQHARPAFQAALKINFS